MPQLLFDSSWTSTHAELVRCQKELAETKQVLGDLLLEKMPVLYFVQDEPSGTVKGVFLDKQKAKAAAFEEQYAVFELVPTI